jgi:hypothetical protein
LEIDIPLADGSRVLAALFGFAELKKERADRPDPAVPRVRRDRTREVSLRHRSTNRPWQPPLNDITPI